MFVDVDGVDEAAIVRLNSDTLLVESSELLGRYAPAHDLACAYHERWEIEIVIDEIDTHQRLVGRTLRSLTPVGVIQELYGILLAHYAVRFLMHEAALTSDVDVDRLSFVHAVEVVRDAVPEFQMVAAAQQQLLYERMLQDIAAVRLPRCWSGSVGQAEAATAERSSQLRKTRTTPTIFPATLVIGAAVSLPVVSVPSRATTILDSSPRYATLLRIT